MCIPIEDRTLQGDIHDAIYVIFEAKGFCDKYVKDEQFLKYMSHQTVYRATPDDNKEEFAKMVEGIDWFIEVAEWRKELAMLANDKLLDLFEQRNAFTDVESFEKGPTSYHQLCYHLGMITFDYMESIR